MQLVANYLWRLEGIEQFCASADFTWTGRANSAVEIERRFRGPNPTLFQWYPRPASWSTTPTATAWMRTLAHRSSGQGGESPGNHRHRRDRPTSHRVSRDTRRGSTGSPNRARRLQTRCRVQATPSLVEKAAALVRYFDDPGDGEPGWRPTR